MGKWTMGACDVAEEESVPRPFNLTVDGQPDPFPAGPEETALQLLGRLAPLHGVEALKAELERARVEEAARQEALRVEQARQEEIARKMALAAEIDIGTAAWRGQEEDVRIVLDVDPSRVADLDWLQMTPLHRAAQGGHRTIIELLVAYRADVHAQNQHRQMPLDMVEVENEDIVQLLRGLGARTSEERYDTVVTATYEDGTPSATTVTERPNWQE